MYASSVAKGLKRHYYVNRTPNSPTPRSTFYRGNESLDVKQALRGVTSEGHPAESIGRFLAIRSPLRILFYESCPADPKERRGTLWLLFVRLLFYGARCKLPKD